MSTRIHIVVDDELLGLVDGARGDVPRSVWVRRAVEGELVRKRLDLPPYDLEETVAKVPAGSEAVLPVFASRREFRPYPKGGR